MLFFLTTSHRAALLSSHFQRAFYLESINIAIIYTGQKGTRVRKTTYEALKHEKIHISLENRPSKRGKILLVFVRVFRSPLLLLFLKLRRHRFGICLFMEENTDEKKNNRNSFILRERGSGCLRIAPTAAAACSHFPSC